MKDAAGMAVAPGTGGTARAGGAAAVAGSGPTGRAGHGVGSTRGAGVRGDDPEWVRGAVRLYLLADTGLVAPERLPEAVAAALRGGVTLVQLRAKGLTTLAQIRLARALRDVCRAGAHGVGNSVPFVVNDRVDVALAAETDGVHVGHIGEEDMEPQDARRLLGPAAIVGVSVGSAREAALAGLIGAGDVLTAVIATCRAVEADGQDAAWGGLAIFTAAAHAAGARCAGPGTFWPALVDALQAVTPAELAPGEVAA